MTALVVALTTRALAGIGAEDVIVVVDPASPDALRVGNHYREVRGVPDRNILYLDPSAASYADLASDQLAALEGFLEGRHLRHVDVVALAPSAFYVPAPGLVTDFCFPVNRFSLSGAWSSLHVADDILAGTLTSSFRNHYFGSPTQLEPFSGDQGYQFGDPSNNGTRYLIGMMLGYTGPRGNTPAELEAMIDVAASFDGAFPPGRFVFNETTDPARSGPRDGLYPAAVSDILGLGGDAEHTCCADMPPGAHDALGIMTGAANPIIVGGDFTFVGPAFADHLTSYAGTFDNGSQVKMSQWVTEGAVGTFGAVEEPCNYAGKFPAPGLHTAYFGGLSLAEAAFRNLQYFPFQGLLYGDPLARPFTHIPVVDVPGLGPGPYSGTVTLTPTFASSGPGADPAFTELLVDGEPAGFRDGLGAIKLRSARYADGPHDVRIRVTDDTEVGAVGVWQATMQLANHGKSASLGVGPLSGDLDTLFTATPGAAGGVVERVQLVANGRLVAAGTSVANLGVYGATLGAGEVDLQVQVGFVDGTWAWSAPVGVSVSALPGTPNGGPPRVTAAVVEVPTDHPTVIHFPTSGDDAADPPEVSVLDNPVHGTLDGWGTWRIVRPAGTEGVDQLTWQATTAGGAAQAELTLVFDPCAGGLALAVPPLVAGATVDLEVRCAVPGEQVVLLHAPRPGDDRIASGALRTGLDGPKVVGPLVAAADGTATFAVTLPPGAPDGLTWYLQAAQYGVTSDVEVGTVQ